MTCKRNISRGCCFQNSQQEPPTVTPLIGCRKMETFDWLKLTPNPRPLDEIYEIQFKNTRKGYYVNSAKMSLKMGDIVVVEAAPGTDIGVVTMSADLVARQMRSRGFNMDGAEFKKILRTPSTYDIERWQEAIAMEHQTMIKSRQISASMGLDMKIGDVEYQADRMKAIFYYIADGRVDFRELIKVLAEQFRIRVEMKQIGARQEAGRIGGIGACGRELCCSTWQGNFSTVSITAARVQDISPNPQKLAGQCGKLKCCLNFEMDVYVDARNSLPRMNGPIETADANYFLVKTDVLRGIMYFAVDPKNPVIQVPLTSEKVKQILALQRKGQKIESLDQYAKPVEIVDEEPAFENVVGQDSLTRFDKSKSSSSSRGGRNNRRGGGGNQGGGERRSGNEGSGERREGGGNNEQRRSENQGGGERRSGSEGSGERREGGGNRGGRNRGRGGQGGNRGGNRGGQGGSQGGGQGSSGGNQGANSGGNPSQQ